MVQKYDMHSKDGTWDDNYEMRAQSRIRSVVKHPHMGVYTREGL